VLWQSTVTGDPPQGTAADISIDWKSMDIQSFLSRIIKPFRLKRMVRFVELIRPTTHQKILDIGGHPFNWNLIDYRGPVVMLNLDETVSSDLRGNHEFVVGDGTALEYGDNEFDIVFSNSVIEHVGGPEQQERFAREALRVGQRMFLQTPARSFFFEPHYVTPFIHFLSPRWQKKLLRRFSVWGWLARPSQKWIDDFVDQTRLLGYDELKHLFPGCTILREKFLFMTKSYIVVKLEAG